MPKHQPERSEELASLLNEERTFVPSKQLRESSQLEMVD
jgi:hypothetical protein